jgi:hypothetical protein
VVVVVVALNKLLIQRLERSVEPMPTKFVLATLLFGVERVVKVQGRQT